MSAFGRTLALMTAGILVTLSADAFVLSGSRWLDSMVVFSYDPTTMDNQAVPAVDLAAAIEAAAASWSGHTPLVLTTSPGTDDPCTLPTQTQRQNAVAISSTRCAGLAFPSGTLAVTVSWAVAGEIIQAGVVLNAAYDWDVYSGSHLGETADMQRVMTHELGHAIGISHSQDTSAIMAPLVSHLRQPQIDDLSALHALYEEQPLAQYNFESTLQAKSATLDQDFRTDVDGDGVEDSIVYRESDGLWTIAASTRARPIRLRFGGPGFQPHLQTEHGVVELATRNQRTGEWSSWGPWNSR